MGRRDRGEGGLSGLLPCNRAQFLRRFCCPQLEHLLLSSFPSVFFSFVFSFIHFSFVYALTGIFLCLPFSYTLSPSLPFSFSTSAVCGQLCAVMHRHFALHTHVLQPHPHTWPGNCCSRSLSFPLFPAASCAKPRPLFMRLIREQRVKLSQHANSKQHSPFNRFERSTKAEHKTNIYNENNVLSCTSRSPSCCFYC